MTITSAIAIILVVLPSLALLLPRETLAILAELKRQLRQKLIQRNEQQTTQELAQSFRSKALENGFEPDLIEEVLEEHFGIIVERLGKIKQIKS